MIRPTTTRRTGFSLIEVFVAMFIMAIGMIALLTLFPVGAVQMGHALRDDRSQTTALQADATLRMWWQKEVVEAPSWYYGGQTVEDAPFYVMDNANDTWNGLPVVSATGMMPPSPPYVTTNTHAAPTGVLSVPQRTPPSLIPATSPLPSFPVLLDPIGLNSYTGASQYWVAGNTIPLAQYAVPRRSIRSTVGNPPLTQGQALSLIPAIRTCTLFDDIEFSRTADSGATPGYPDPTAGSFQVVRQGRYNWGAVIQRQNNSFRNIADLKILVYDRRAPGIAPADAEQMYGIAGLAVGTTQITLPATLDVLKLRYNSWILDGTINVDPANPNLNIRNANFYRVQSVTEVGASTVVELQTPIKPPTGSSGLANYTAQIYVLSNLIDVFDRPQLVPSNFIQQVP